MNKGNYYKKKTKEWLEKEGYKCEYLEKLQRIITKTGKLIFVKKDLFGADILAVNSQKIIFIQVKSGAKNTGINIKKAITEFNKYSFPEFVDRWIIIWETNNRIPKIIDLKEVIVNGNIE